METPDFKEPKKELSSEDHAIVIERNVIKYYISTIDKNKQLPSKEIEKIESNWIKKYALKFRKLFTNQQNELIELYEKNEQEAIEFIKSELEKEE
jgi:hypothetical protein